MLPPKLAEVKVVFVAGVCLFQVGFDADIYPRTFFGLSKFVVGRGVAVVVSMRGGFVV
jgi:hypothetical protein